MKPKFFNVMALCSVIISLFALYLSISPIVSTYKDALFSNPVLGEFRAVRWQFDPIARFWSAHVYGIKIDNDCKYKPGQIVRAYGSGGANSPKSEIVVNFVDDDTPDSNKPAGFHDFGRWEFQAPNIFQGFVLRVRIEHECPNRRPGEQDVETDINPFTVGIDSK